MKSRQNVDRVRTFLAIARKKSVEQDFQIYTVRRIKLGSTTDVNMKILIKSGYHKYKKLLVN